MNQFADFLYSLEFDAAPNPADNLAWGRLSLTLDGQEIWFQQDSSQDDPVPAYWTWSDLLAHLGQCWPALLHEESYPLDLNPVTPLELRRRADESWEGMDETQVDEEDEELCRFEYRHDLAAGLNGIYLPSLFIMREGKRAWVCAEGVSLRMGFDQVIQVLTRLGDEIATQLQNSTNPRAVLAVSQWKSRNDCAVEDIIKLKMGWSADDIRLLAGNEPVNEYWNVDSKQGIFDSEILAAARYSSSILDIKSQRDLLSIVKSFKPIETPMLDQLSSECTSFISSFRTAEPFIQGYEAAGWLRNHLGIIKDADPQNILTSWGVKVQEVTVSRGLEALAFWGPSHGPAILINITEGAVCKKDSGLRATLAHEICHLLIDRTGSLPFADAIGGSTPAWVEKRARAFAAEFLLPRERAAQRLEQNGISTITTNALDIAIKELAETYQVSTGLVIHQLKNSRARHALPREVANDLLRRNREVSGGRGDEVF